MEDCFFCC